MSAPDPRLHAVRRAIFDPGQFVKREVDTTDGGLELLWVWQARAVLAALPETLGYVAIEQSHIHETPEDAQAAADAAMSFLPDGVTFRVVRVVAE